MPEDQGQSFTVNVLLSEPLEFTWDEITAAINEDYPTCAVKGGFNLPGPQRTDGVVVGALQPVEPANGSVLAFSTPGYPDSSFQQADHTDLGFNSARFAGAVPAVQSHKSYLAISITATDGSLAARFRAARQLSCVTAVFASLPITLGILVTWANQVVSPADWTSGTNEAVTGTWPLMNWITCRGAWDAATPGSNMAVGMAIGLSAFADTELHHAPAPAKPSDVIAMLYTMTHMMLELGHDFNDADTLGGEDGSILYRTRFRPENAGFDHTVRVMIRHDSPMDDIAEFGPRHSVAPDDRTDHLRAGKKGFLRGILGRN